MIAPLAMAGIGVASNIYGAEQAKKRARKAEDKLNALSSQAYPELTPTDELNRYKSLVLNGIINPRGINAADKAAAQTATSRAVNTGLYNAKTQTGGNASRFLATAYMPSVVNNANDVILQDARMKDVNYNANIGRFGGVVNQFQNISDRNNMNRLNRRMLTEQALGKSILQNQAYAQNTYNNLASDLMGAGTNMAAYMAA